MSSVSTFVNAVRYSSPLSMEDQLREQLSFGETPYGVYSKTTIDEIVRKACELLGAPISEAGVIIRGIICFAILSFGQGFAMHSGTEVETIDFSFVTGKVRMPIGEFFDNVFPARHGLFHIEFFTRAFGELTRRMVQSAQDELYNQYGVSGQSKYEKLFSLTD